MISRPCVQISSPRIAEHRRCPYGWLPLLNRSVYLFREVPKFLHLIEICSCIY